MWFASCVCWQALTFVILVKEEMPYGQEFVSRSLNLDWTFGMCLTSNLTALHRLAWAYLSPVYLLSLVALSCCLSRIHRLQHVFGRYAVIRTFWQFILLSFSGLATTSFQLLCYTSLLPTADSDKFYGTSTGHLRFALDANQPYFAGDHLPWAIVASVVAAVCVFVPFTLPFLHRHHKLKPLYDIYTGVYRDEFTWWSSVDLIRRLVLAAIFAVESDPNRQQLALVLTCLILLAAQAVAWPFKTRTCNCIETVLLLSLSCIAVLSGPDVTYARSVAIQVLFFVPVCTLFVAWLLSQRLPAKWLQRTGSGSKLKNFQLSMKGASLERYVRSTSTSSNSYGLRESLLADPSLQPYSESQSR